MIEAPQHPLHTLVRSSPYTYNLFQHLLLRSGVLRMTPQPHVEPTHSPTTAASRAWGLGVEVGITMTPWHCE
jgi:hypothetical protein